MAHHPHSYSPLDIEETNQLEEYLRAHDHLAAGEHLRVEILAGGVSCRTVLAHLPDGRTWVMKQPLAKLRVPIEWCSQTDRSHLEALGLLWMQKLTPPGSSPSLIFEDETQNLLAMTAVPQPHANWKSLLLAGKIDADHIRQFGRLLGELHRRSHEMRKEVEPIFRSQHFFTSLRLEPYYGYSAQQVPAASAFLEKLMADTVQRRFALVHGDYSPKNVLVHDGRLVLLDYEVIHWGDPAFDVGFSMTHLLSKAHHVKACRTRFAESVLDYWREYRDSLGPVEWANDLETAAVRHTLACLLSRVAGRSRLEYLTPVEQQQQHTLVVHLMAQPPQTIEQLVHQFVKGLDNAGH